LYETTPPVRRRWFRFSLRTLLVVVLLLAVPLAWMGVQLKWIRDRHAFRLKHLTSIQGGINLNQERAAKLVASGFPKAAGRHIAPPGMLWLFGEYAFANLDVAVSSDDVRQINGDSYVIPANHAEVVAAKRLFPESEITIYWWDSGNQKVHEVTLE